MGDIPAEQPLSMMQVDFCVTAASKQYEGVSPWMLKTLLAVEGGQIGTIRKNSNKSFDLGPMQINTIHLADIASTLKTSARQLVFDPCKNIAAGAWLLSKHMKDADGRYWLAMGNYHSKTPKVRAIYLRKVADAYSRLLVASKDGNESKAIGRTTNWGRNSNRLVPSLARLEEIIDNNPGAVSASVTRKVSRKAPPEPRIVAIDNQRKKLRFID